MVQGEKLEVDEKQYKVPIVINVLYIFYRHDIYSVIGLYRLRADPGSAISQ